MNCYICGNTATRRLTPDMDIHGLSLCDSKDCQQLLLLGMWTDTEKSEKFLDRIRKRKHKENNNPWKPSSK